MEATAEAKLAVAAPVAAEAELAVAAPVAAEAKLAVAAPVAAEAEPEVAAMEPGAAAEPKPVPCHPFGRPSSRS